LSDQPPSSLRKKAAETTFVDQFKETGGVGTQTHCHTPTSPVLAKSVTQAFSLLEKLTDKNLGRGDPFSTIAGVSIPIANGVTTPPVDQ